MWQSILDDTTRVEAIRVAVGIARALAHHDWEGRLCDSLADGKLGYVLLLDTCVRAGLVDDDDELATTLLESVVDGYASGAGLSPSLFYGAGGWAWLCHHIRRDDASTPDDGFDQVVSLIEANMAASLHDLGHGLSSGVAGVAVYALEALHRPTARSLLSDVLDTLAARAESQPEGITWRMPAPQWRPERAPRGYYNLGLAHGIPGIISVAAAIHARCDGELARKARALIVSSVPWLLAQRRSVASGSAFPEWTGPGVAEQSTGLGWCYGDLGASLALVAAARATGEDAWERTAHDLARTSVGRASQLVDVADLGICHGLASTAHLCNRLYHATGDPVFAATAEHHILHVLERASRGPSERPGLLSGAVGIALVLLAAALPIEPVWDRVLLLS